MKRCRLTHPVSLKQFQSQCSRVPHVMKSALAYNIWLIPPHLLSTHFFCITQPLCEKGKQEEKNRISFFVHLFWNRMVTRDIKLQLASFEIATHGLRPLCKIISIKNNMNRTRNLITWLIEILNRKTNSKNGIRT